MLEKVNDKLSAHALNKYVPLMVSTVRTGWPVLLGTFALAFLLSMSYMLIIECCAGVLIWISLAALVIAPGSIGAYLINASYNGGLDSIPSSGDDETDRNMGIVCCVVSAFFLLVCCCMAKAVNRAVAVCEAAAACIFHARSLLLEPIINLV